MHRWAHYWATPPSAESKAPTASTPSNICLHSCWLLSISPLPQEWKNLGLCPTVRRWWWHFSSSPAFWWSMVSSATATSAVTLANAVRESFPHTCWWLPHPSSCCRHWAISLSAIISATLSRAPCRPSWFCCIDNWACFLLQASLCTERAHQHHLRAFPFPFPHHSGGRSFQNPWAEPAAGVCPFPRRHHRCVAAGSPGFKAIGRSMMIDWMNTDRSSFILTIRSSLLVSIHPHEGGERLLYMVEILHQTTTSSRYSANPRTLYMS